jgi:transposase
MKQSTHPQWALKLKTPGTELRLIRGNYYLYEYKTIYNREKKKPKKISGKMIGRITQQDGLIPSAKRQLERTIKREVLNKIYCKEYGMSFLIQNKFSKHLHFLQQAFPQEWKHIAAIAYCRFVYRCPLKRMPFYLSQSFLPEMLKLKAFNDKTSSLILHTIGKKREKMLEYMRSFISKEGYLLMDATNVFSNSTLIPLSKKGYNSHLNYNPQFNLMYIYSVKKQTPVYYRLLPGNIREVKAFKNCLLEAGLDNAVIIADKGFYSKKNIDLLLEENLKFILPLKRDNLLIDYSSLADNSFKTNNLYFEHEGRIIWYRKFNAGQLSLFLYMDDTLKVNEERDYLRRIQTHPESYSNQEYHNKRNTFGTIALLTGFKKKSAIDVYQTYKSRMAIEVFFDGMKNVLEADHTYMQDESTLQGWMFINHITLQWYQQLYIELKDKSLLKTISVNDYIQLLTDLKKILINDTWYLNEITSHTSKMIEKIGLSIV